MSDRLTAVIRAAEHVVSRAVEGGAMLVDLQTGACFRLNRVGAEVWRGISESVPLPQTCEALATRYGISRDTVDKDVAALLEELESKGLVAVEPTQP